MKSSLLLFCAGYFSLLCAVSFADQKIAQEHYRSGMNFYEKGDYVNAELEFKKALNESKQAENAYYKKGLELYSAGKYKEAEEQFKQALEIRDNANDQHYKRGLILYNQGKYKEAQEEFRKAITTVKKEESSAGSDLILPIGEAGPAAALSPAGTGEYRINNGDLIVIKVWQNPDLDDQVIVRPDGMISFPLVGDVMAAGFTVTQFREDVTLKLREFIRNPQVSVSIKEFGGKRVVVLGQVKSPGVYSVTGRKTILEAVGLAGGFTEDAVPSSVMLVKGGFANPQPQRLDLAKALKRADISDNLVLESEDMIYVPRRFIKDVNYFLKLFLDPVASGLFIKRELRDF